MENTALEIIRSFFEIGEKFTFTPQAGGALIVGETYTFDILPDGRFEQTLTKPVDQIETDDAGFVCGDYPAPCNCDDPKTHNGH